MKFMIGLGNPGSEYSRSRHNVGFMVIEQLAKILGAPPWQTSHKLKAETIKLGDLILVKPQDFMNNSGRVTRQVLDFYQKNLQLDQVIVIHDDLDIRLGEYKLQLGKGPKSHNGLLDLDRYLGSQEYWHVRVGVDNRSVEQTGVGGAAYVLANFSPQELEVLAATENDLVQQLKELIDK